MLSLFPQMKTILSLPRPSPPFALPVRKKKHRRLFYSRRGSNKNNCTLLISSWFSFYSTEPFKNLLGAKLMHLYQSKKHFYNLFVFSLRFFFFQMTTISMSRNDSFLEKQREEREKKKRRKKEKKGGLRQHRL